MYNTVENEDDQFERKQIQPEKCFTNPSMGISVPHKKSSGVCATETQKWPFHYQRAIYDAVEFATSLKVAWQNFKATNGWTVKYMYCKGLLLCSRTTLVHRLP